MCNALGYVCGVSQDGVEYLAICRDDGFLSFSDCRDDAVMMTQAKFESIAANLPEWFNRPQWVKSFWQIQ